MRHDYLCRLGAILPKIISQGVFVTILVVDDEPLLRRLLRSMLERSGFDVDEAQDGHDALSKIRDFYLKTISTSWVSCLLSSDYTFFLDKKSIKKIKA